MMLLRMMLGLVGLAAASNPRLVQRDSPPSNEVQQYFDPVTRPMNQVG